jgi:hypothetical protein
VLKQGWILFSIAWVGIVGTIELMDPCVEMDYGALLLLSLPVWLRPLVAYCWRFARRGQLRKSNR